MSPDEIPMPIAPTALPALDTFIGVYQQLAELPHPEKVETLDLTCEPIYETRLDAVCPLLSKLTALTSLDIWTHVFDPHRDHTPFFTAILAACPNLTDFHFMCTTSFTVKPLKQLLAQLYRLPSLKRFSLTKGHKYLDESMLSTAMRILKHTPALRQVNIRWAREQCPNHLKQEGSYDVVLGRDARPESVAVVERGIPLVGRPFCRRFKVGIGFGKYNEPEERREGKGKRTSWVGGASFGVGFKAKSFGENRTVDSADGPPAVEATAFDAISSADSIPGSPDTSASSGSSWSSALSSGTL